MMRDAKPIRDIDSGLSHRAGHMTMLISFLAVTSILIGLCACGSGGQSGLANTTSGQPRTVQGTQIVSWLSETGTIDVPDDLSKTTITAYVPNNSGGYEAMPGSGTSDGHYSIPNVAAGYYLLQIGSSYFWTSATNIDTGSQVQGRPNLMPSAVGQRLDTNVALSVPIESADIFELVDFNTSSASSEIAWDMGRGVEYIQSTNLLAW
jgi:hypothetical protein